jgi:hypothetical protein
MQVPLAPLFLFEPLVQSNLPDKVPVANKIHSTLLLLAAGQKQLRWPVRLGVSLLLVSLGGVWVRECRLSMGSLRLQRGCGRMLM